MPWSVEVFPPEAFDEGAALMLAEALCEAEAAMAPRLLLLAGGTTPAGVYRQLARLAGTRWHPEAFVLALGDERIVPDDEAALRNETLVQKELIAHLPPPQPLFLAPPHVTDAEQAARRYEEELRRHLGTTPAPALTLLGLGPDGHTASLFPGDETLTVQDAWVAPARAPSPPTARVTLTVPLLARSRRVFFLVRGEGKAAVLRRLLAGDPSLPAATIPFSGQVSVLADRAALP